MQITKPMIAPVQSPIIPSDIPTGIPSINGNQPHTNFINMPKIKYNIRRRIIPPTMIPTSILINSLGFSFSLH
jgi:hypothetical protein